MGSRTRREPSDNHGRLLNGIKDVEASNNSQTFFEAYMYRYEQKFSDMR